MTSPLRVALIGAGPAGIYAADILSKSELDVSIDLYERLPTPFGLVRYGVAPDHPRIKQIIVALQKILARGDVRFIGNVDVGRDVTLSEMRQHYDAVIISTGADRDAPLPIPGADLPGCYGAAEFVSWYDGHPDVPRTWPLEAQSVAVLGVGNVALDVARILAKHVEDLLADVAMMLAELHVQFGHRVQSVLTSKGQRVATVFPARRLFGERQGGRGGLRAEKSVTAGGAVGL